MKMVPLGDLMPTRTQSLNPAKHADEEFELHSIPAFDRGRPDIALGRDIGSSKQVVQPGDVLISKIVPHIRRSTVIPQPSGRRQLASGEWIVFRDYSYDPKYLVHFLTSDIFHQQFLNTVAGVGGSLLRARPQYVRSIMAPLPHLDEQRRIASILDKADAIRQKRRQAIAHLGKLAQSIFHDLFREHKDFIELQTVCDKITDGTHQSPQWDNSGVPFLFVSNITSGEIDFSTKKFISEGTWSDLTRRTPIEIGDILYSTVGSFGIPAVVRTTSRFAFQRHIAHIKPVAEKIDSDFLSAQLASTFVLRQANRAARGIAQPTINLADIKKYSIIVPPLEEQRRFSSLNTRIRSQKRILHQSAQELDQLFASLQSRAFRGEL